MEKFKKKLLNESYFVGNYPIQKNEKIFEKTIDKSQQVWYDYIIKGEMFLQYTFNCKI